VKVSSDVGILKRLAMASGRGERCATLRRGETEARHSPGDADGPKDLDPG